METSPFESVGEIPPVSQKAFTNDLLVILHCYEQAIQNAVKESTSIKTQDGMATLEFPHHHHT